ncbi:hypothetical protein GGR21_002885 [Dysgonomonas hofstadii]|uniref:Uncharacterized protein n=1 Tax=Dysgonomonas hofstadii TaxID=637886 RepID=A0A840CPH7_9BACT|nr:hypothetical protein [Dysgonomonas hofstadii]
MVPRNRPFATSLINTWIHAAGIDILVKNIVSRILFLTLVFERNIYV